MLKKPWATLALSFVLCSYFFQSYPNFKNPNGVSRVYLTMALVDYRTTRIDPLVSRYGRVSDVSSCGGHTYSAEAIGLSILAIPFYLICKGFASLLNFEFSLGKILYVVRVACSVLPTLACLCMLDRILRKIAPSPRVRWSLQIAYLVSTPALVFSSMLFGHQLSAAVLLAALLLLWRLRRNIKTPTRYFFGAGLLFGYGAVTEYTLSPVLPIALIYLWLVGSERKKLLLFLAGISLPIAVLGGYNLVSFRNPFILSYAIAGAARFTAIHSRGVYGVSVPSLTSTCGILISPSRGLFYLCPWLLLALPGLFVMARVRSWRPEFFTLLSIILCFFYATASYGGWRGSGVGPRFLVPILPLLVIAAAFCWHNDGKIKRIAGFLFPPLAVFSGLLCLAATATFPIFPQKLEHPFCHLVLHLLKNNYLRPNWGAYLGLPSWLPPLLVLGSLFGAGLLLPPRPALKSLFYRSLLCLLIVAVITGGYYLSWPKTLTGRELSFRAQVETWIGRYDLAYADLKLIKRYHPDFPLKQLIEILFKNIWKESDRTYFACRVFELYQEG